MRPEPLGILGGTFDPVHNAHLKLAEAAMSRLRLGGILWIPAGCPPHRAPPVASAEDRLAMVRLAISGRPGWAVDDAEVMANAPSWTIHTLERLVRLRAEPLVLLMGADAFLGFTAWHRWQDILKLTRIAVASRPGYAPEVPEGVITFPLEAGTVSSTTVRALLAAGGRADELLPPPVLEYIASHRLYATD